MKSNLWVTLRGPEVIFHIFLIKWFKLETVDPYYLLYQFVNQA